MNEISTKLKLLLSTEKCFHIKSQIKLEQNVFYCSKCGIISYKTKKKLEHFTRSNKVKLTCPIDINPFETLENCYKRNVKENEILQGFPKWYIQIRKKIINFLYLISKKFHSQQKTVFLAISYMDEIFRKKNKNFAKNRKKLYLYILSCFILAFKFNEIDNGLNIIEDNRIESICKYLKIEVSVSELDKYEIKCVKLLEYNLNKFTLFDIISYIKFSGFIFQNEIKNKEKNLVNEIYEKIDDILDLIISNSDFIERYNAYQIAFGIIHYVRIHFGLEENVMENLISNEIYKFIAFEDYYLCYKNIEKTYSREEKEEEKNYSNLYTLPSQQRNNDLSFKSPVKVKRKLTDEPYKVYALSNRVNKVGKVLDNFVNDKRNNVNAVETEVVNSLTAKKINSKSIFKNSYTNRLMRNLQINNELFSPLINKSKHCKNSQSINEFSSHSINNHFNLKSLSAVKSDLNTNFCKIYLSKPINNKIKISKKLVLPKIL